MVHSREVMKVNARGTDPLNAATKLASHMDIEFSGSTGWLWRFRKIHGIGYKKVQGNLGVKNLSERKICI